MSQYKAWDFNQPFEIYEGLNKIKLQEKPAKPTPTNQINRGSGELDPDTEEALKAYKMLHNPQKTRREFECPMYVICSKTASYELNLEPDSFASSVPYMVGQANFPGATSFCSNYCGHQFGQYNILGDGRTVTVGKRNNFIFQLRGLGPTNYSQGKDGTIPLVICVQEFLISEALSKLGIPTARNLCLAASTTPAQFENNASLYLSGILTRYAQSWVRFGTFEYLYYRGDHETLKGLSDYIIKAFYPDILVRENVESLKSSRLISGEFFNTQSETIDGCNLAPNVNIESMLSRIQEPLTIRLNRYALLLRRVIDKTAFLVASWQANGFVHGLLHTENFSIIGITLQFENSGFMDSYDPQWTPNCYGSKGLTQMKRNGIGLSFNLKMLNGHYQDWDRPWST
jgi:uncharacterized protein YdiU (UPF0061 family)